MTGVGKTACARELVDISAGEFDTVLWHSVSASMANPSAALVGFAEALDGQHQGLGLRAAVSSDDFGTVVSALADRCRRTRVLTVLDDAESLLDAQGRWLAAEWEVVVAASHPAAAAPAWS